jgi:DNA-binding winged helix-turn-helix (wHTH) protein/TolB-like protein/tetratricopeptide (TPR) repeat protein
MDVAAEAPPQRIDLCIEPPFRVGAATIDPASRDATFGEHSERLQPQNLKVLIALARHRGKVVTRDQLIDLCWDGRVIGDDVINRSISMLRQFAARSGGFEIETVPRAGYRLIEARSRTRITRRLLAGAGAALAAMIALGTFLVQRSEPPPPPATISVGLLPFATDSSDPTVRKIAFAARDALAHTLSNSGMPVKLVAPSSKGEPLAVDFLMSGDVSSGPDKIAVSVRMEEAKDHFIVYSRRFEASREAAGTLPNRVGVQVAGELGWTRPLLVLNQLHPSDPAVVSQMFEKLEPGGLGMVAAYENGRRIAAKAPNSAVAQLHIAFSAAFALSDLPRSQRLEAVTVGRHAQARAQKLAPEFGDAQSPWCLLRSRVWMAECEDRLRKAMRLDPDSPFVDWFASDLLSAAGRFDESLHLARRSLARDQYMPAKIELTVRMLEATGRSDEAEKLYQQGRRWWPEFGDLTWARVSGMIDGGAFDSIPRFERAIGRSNWPAGYESIADVAAAAQSNSVAEARRVCPKVASESLRTILCILVLAKVGDRDRAFAIADRLYPARIGRTPVETDRIWLDKPFVHGTEYLTGPGAAALRLDPRYLALAKRVGLVDYWRGGRLPDFCRERPEPICSKLTPSPS